MKYTFFDQLRDAFEREAHAANFHVMNDDVKESFLSLGKLSAYADVLENLGHTVSFELSQDEDKPGIVKAIVDSRDLMHPEMEV